MTTDPKNMRGTTNNFAGRARDAESGARDHMRDVRGTPAGRGRDVRHTHPIYTYRAGLMARPALSNMYGSADMTCLNINGYLNNNGSLLGICDAGGEDPGSFTSAKNAENMDVNYG